MKPEYKSAKELYQETLAEARTMPETEIKQMLRKAAAFHPWAVRAFIVALTERQVARLPK